MPVFMHGAIPDLRGLAESMSRWVKIPAARRSPSKPLGDRPAKPLRTGTRRAIGLLGGSFNPAHEGHRHISLTAMKRLGLDEIWWLVSPQNPLKPVRGMAPFAQRLAGARAAARHSPDQGHGYRKPPRQQLYGRNPDPACAPPAAAEIRLADGRGQSRPDRPLEGLALHLSPCPYCGFCQAYLFFKSAGRKGGAAVCPVSSEPRRRPGAWSGTRRPDGCS